MSQIKAATKSFEIIPDEQIAKFAKAAMEKYPSEKS
jgi:hypothetical protein